MIDWQLVGWYAIAIVVILICRRYARCLWRANLFERGGPYRAGLIIALGAVLIPVLLLSTAIITNLFNLKLTSLAILLGILASISIPILVVGYGFGRYIYKVYSAREVERLKQEYEASQKHH